LAGAVKLLSVEEARARMLAGLRPLPVEEVPLARAHGRFLAGPVLATRDQPPFAASAMDGWAVRVEDGEGPRRIVGESAAGHGYAGNVGPGEAVRIFTGAAVPAGADAVVIQEDARREGDRLFVPPVTGPRHIRRAGLDFRLGDLLLSAGVRLDPWRLSLAAAAGVAEPSVFAQPTVTILSTGEEVVEPGAAPGPFQIFNSGSAALTALTESWGARAVALPPVGDDLEATARAVGEAGGDLVVTLGGASVGDHDLVKPALARLGLRLVVESVAVRPGKPTWFGILGDGRSVLGLPGNPASALVCAELFLRPILRTLQGAEPGPRLVMAQAEQALPANGDREHWMRARLIQGADGVLRAKPLRDQDSSLVTMFAEADGLVRRARRAPALSAGDEIEALILERLS
jgi:molybdopterin molybdotransferase